MTDYLDSWQCPAVDRHNFVWTSSSSNLAQPSGYCRCGLAYYDAKKGLVTVRLIQLESKPEFAQKEQL